MRYGSHHYHLISPKPSLVDDTQTPIPQDIVHFYFHSFLMKVQNLFVTDIQHDVWGALHNSADGSLLNVHRHYLQ